MRQKHKEMQLKQQQRIKSIRTAWHEQKDDPNDFWNATIDFGTTGDDGFWSMCSEAEKAPVTKAKTVPSYAQAAKKAAGQDTPGTKKVISTRFRKDRNIKEEVAETKDDDDIALSPAAAADITPKAPASQENSQAQQDNQKLDDMLEQLRQKAHAAKEDQEAMKVTINGNWDKLMISMNEMREQLSASSKRMLQLSEAMTQLTNQAAEDRAHIKKLNDSMAAMQKSADLKFDHFMESMKKQGESIELLMGSESGQKAAKAAKTEPASAAADAEELRRKDAGL